MIHTLIKQLKDTEANAKKDLENAQKTKQDIIKAAKEEAAKQKKEALAEVEDKIQKMLAQAMDEAYAEIEKLKTKTEKDTQKIRKNAEKRIDLAVNTVIQRVTNGNS